MASDTGKAYTILNYSLILNTFHFGNSGVHIVNNNVYYLASNPCNIPCVIVRVYVYISSRLIPFSS